MSKSFRNGTALICSECGVGHFAAFSPYAHFTCEECGVEVTLSDLQEGPDEEVIYVSDNILYVSELAILMSDTRTLCPLSTFARVTFAHRGDCAICGRIDVISTLRAGRLICALCTMTGK